MAGYIMFYLSLYGPFFINDSDSPLINNKNYFFANIDINIIKYYQIKNVYTFKTFRFFIRVYISALVYLIKL